jgi:hypothetical protein
MRVVCIDNSANGRQWLTNGAVYEVFQAFEDEDGAFFQLVETGPMYWWANRFKPFDDTEKFTAGADAASEAWDNRRKQKERAQ